MQVQHRCNRTHTPPDRWALEVSYSLHPLSVLWEANGDLGCRKAADSLSGHTVVVGALLPVLGGALFSAYIGGEGRP